MPKKPQPIIHLLTKEGEALLAADKSVIPWKNAYPRPRMRRNSFFCLNGTWQLSIDECDPQAIRVPFPPESLLSGVNRDVAENARLRYDRTFSLPDGFVPTGSRLLLHLGAVDQYVEVHLNGHPIPSENGDRIAVGAYRPNTYDITQAVRIHGENSLRILAWDCLGEACIPYGKQSLNRGGMWYTPVSGIWQTVWLEAVPETYIEDLRVVTKDNTVTVTAVGVSEGQIEVDLPTGTMTYPLKDGVATFAMDDPRLWSPENPYLYTFRVTAGKDQVTSYFALRTLEIRTVDGIPRLCLNGSPYFFHGLLDQGYFSDGIFTPADEKGFERDILAMKSLGFNTLRKHIKVEPEQFYYDCDRLGMIVFQDMINNGHYSFIRDTVLPTMGLKRRSDKRLHPLSVSRKTFEEAMVKTVEHLSFHPCICYWTIFNEGWGQFESQRMFETLKALDNTRFIDTVSGWFKGAGSDVDSEHVYFKPVKLKYGDKPMVLSEFGGYAWKIDGHAANPVSTYGYRMFKDGKAFEDALVKLYEDEIIPAVSKGLCGAIYTQVSDVEDETNGLFTYDRCVMKVTPTRMQAVANALAAEIKK